MTDRAATAEAVAAVWRIDGARVLATLAAFTGDLGTAEDLCQDALADALRKWPDGVPRNPAGWLTTVAKRKAIDGWRRAERLEEHRASLGRAAAPSAAGPEDEVVEAEPIADDLLRLVFTACHPVLGREARIALTLRTVGGLSTEQIARMFLIPVPTVQAYWGCTASASTPPLQRKSPRPRWGWPMNCTCRMASR